MQELDRVNYFGVRHLSPGAAWHLRSYLDDIKPDLVLIEGFSDANEVIPYLSDKVLRPPVAILAYTKSLPVKTLVYPLAEYSPEFQAIKWASENSAKAAFIDLSSGVFMGLSEKEYSGGKESSYFNIYQQVSNVAGEDNYDAHWERTYEHISLKGSFKTMVLELGKTMRLIEENDRDFFRAENLLREAYMRRQIQKYIEAGFSPEKIVVVAGAYHVPSFRSNEHIMTDDEEKALNKCASSLTLMPYSFSRLSSQSGYGAGNNAPAYYELIWELQQKGKLDDLASVYLSHLTEKLRSRGFVSSSAHIIETVRLAHSLASLKEGQSPVLADLKDAATTVIGEGKKEILEKCMEEIEVGKRFGRLPENSLKTSVQDDFDRNMKELKLERYRQNFLQTLKLDLRENLNVKSKRAAFLSLERSKFLHRLCFLKIPFANFDKQNDKDWLENWSLNWMPESEISLVETILLGETIEIASAVKFNRELRDCHDIKTASTLLKVACLCGLTKELSRAQNLLQNLVSDSADLLTLAQTTSELSDLINFGSVRNLETKDFIPLLEEIFIEASLQIQDASNCDSEGAKNVLKALDLLNQTSNSSTDIVDTKLYETELTHLSLRDDLNPSLSGYATALLLEKNLITEGDLSNEFCRRVSPGIDADLGAGWFEGLAQRNRLVLVKKKKVWEQMSLYIDSLDEEQFKRALVFMRRTFANFAPSEIKQIAGAVSKILGISPEENKELTKLELSESELELLDDLDF